LPITAILQILHGSAGMSLRERIMKIDSVFAKLSTRLVCLVIFTKGVQCT